MVARNTLHIDGALGTTGERWSVGFTYTVIGGGSILGGPDLDSWVNHCAGFVGSSSANEILDEMSPDCSVDRLRAYGYGPTGGALVAAVLPITPAVGTGTGRQVNQAARVVSLRTALPGASGRGRAYFPATGAVITTGTRKSATPAGYLTSVVAMLNRFRKINAAGPDELELVVHSRTLNVVTPVTGVRVGDVIDTQRRRRDALVELYESASIP